MSGQKGLLNRSNGWSKQTPPRRQDLSYLTHIMSMSALAQQLRLQDQGGKRQMRSRLAKAGHIQSRCSSRAERSASGRVSRASYELSAARNCTRDEGGPFEFGDQEPISSHRKLLRAKAVVV